MGAVGGREPILCLEPGRASWPTELDDIEDPPERLWARGRIERLSVRPRVAVVGTRSPTAYGASQARRFARELAAAGVSIVSGLARGIDQAAHEGALEVGGSTLAVLGSGVDRPWPAGELGDRVAAHGVLLSELELGEPPRRHHFPRRNRLISGLASGVVVIEAAYASGSLITARWAADQGRTVFAVPGRVDHPMSAGCHRLIREGALLVERPMEVLQELGIAEAGAAIPSDPARSLLEEPDELARLLDRELRGETLTADELAVRVESPLGEVLARLVELELAGRVVRGPGGLYRRG